MYKRFTSLAAAVVVGAGVLSSTAWAADSSAADPNGNLIGLTNPNGKLVYDFINMWFNEHKANEAFDKYVARKGYLNHAVYSSTTKTVNNTFEQEKKDEARAAGPTTHFDIKQIVAQGNLVFVHIAATQGPGGPGEGPATGEPPKGAAPAGPPPAGAGAGPQGGPGGAPQGDGKGPDEMVMILRVHNGKIVDHWDMHVPTNSDSIVFADLDRPLP